MIGTELGMPPVGLVLAHRSYTLDANRAFSLDCSGKRRFGENIRKVRPQETEKK